MESLAVFVGILLLIDLLAGPIAILLTWQKILTAITSQSEHVSLALTIARRLVHGLLVVSGLFIGTGLCFIGVTAGKLLGLFSIITSYIALRREYFRNTYVLRKLLNFLGINYKGISRLKRKELPPVFSADGSEIIRAKKVGRIGRSSGRDGHGPGGQH